MGLMSGFMRRLSGKTAFKDPQPVKKEPPPTKVLPTWTAYTDREGHRIVLGTVCAATKSEARAMLKTQLGRLPQGIKWEVR